MELDLDKFASDEDRIARQKRDYELWQKWQQGGKKDEDAKPLMDAFRPMIQSYTNRYSGNVEIPPIAINAEFTRQAGNAFETYDPNRGAALGTWVGHKLKKGQRWIANHQNTARISEARIYKIGEFQTAQNQLDQELGRPASTRELSERLGWSETQVGRLQQEVRRDLLASAMQVDPTEILPSKEREVLNLLRYDLSNEELQVYEHTLGVNGKPKLSGNEIAGKMGWSPSKVSRVKAEIAKKAKMYF